jgi:hypothetical protein
MPRIARVLPGAILAAALLFGLVTLTWYPAVYGDEAYIGSTAWSLLHGEGFRPSIATGAGVFDNGIDLWAPRLGTAPFVLAELVGPTSLTAYRLAAWLVGLAAIGIFGWPMRELAGRRITIAACAALAATWGYFSASHLVRWDSLAIAFAALLLAILVRAPTPRRALMVGALIGLSFDVSVSISAVTPAAVLLVGWRRDGRWRRLGLMAAGMAAMAAFYYAHHVLPDPDVSSLQYDAIYGSTYKLPLAKALEEGDLSPLLDEGRRYRYMWELGAAPRAGLLTVGAAVLAALAMLTSLSRAYPARAVPGILLLSHLGGLILIQGNKAPIGAWYALPYAIAAIAVAVLVLAERNWRPLSAPPPIRRRALMAGLGALVALPFAAEIRHFDPAIFPGSLLIGLLLVAATATVAAFAVRTDGDNWTAREPVVALLLALAIGAGATTFADARRAPPEPAAGAELERELSAQVGPGESVMGEWLYWWAVRDDRFRFNSAIWLNEFTRGESFESTFARLCPDVVILDDIWLSRYDQTEVFGKIFPTQAPTDPAEREQLRGLLRRDFRKRATLNVDDRMVEVWANQGACHGS